MTFITFDEPGDDTDATACCFGLPLPGDATQPKVRASGPDIVTG